MKHYLGLLHLFAFFIVTLSPLLAQAKEADIIGVDTNGITLRIGSKTGESTPVTDEVYNSFSLGGTARRGNTFHYVVVPSGGTENALYTVSIKSNAISHVDLDRSEDVRALFFVKKKLFGVFYDGNAGTAGVYRINTSTGGTTLVLDLSDLDVEPIPGAITRTGRFHYLLVKPEADGGRRKLLKFKPTASTPSLVDVVDNTGAPILCNKVKPTKNGKALICLAQDLLETQVNVHRLKLNGSATALATLPEVLRVGSGHTLLTNNNKSYYAFVYAPGEPDNQRLIKFSAKGSLQANHTISTIVIGGHFSAGT